MEPATLGSVVHSSSVGKGPKRLVFSSWNELVELASRGTGSKIVAPLVISRLALTLVGAAIATPVDDMPKCQVERRKCKGAAAPEKDAEMPPNADEANRSHKAVYQTSIDEQHERQMFSR
jgi:hypothetical protein